MAQPQAWSKRACALMAGVAFLISACVTAATSRPASAAPQSSTSHGTAAAATAVRPSGINVEPSMRPWRYVGPNPDSWWCVPPNCTQNADPNVTINTELTLIHSLGSANLRIEFPWALMEPATKGTYDWTRSDAIVAAANAHGVTLQPIIVYTPSWSASYPSDAPGSASDFGDFVKALVGRYKSSIHIWEMWNEPNLSVHYWTSGNEALFVQDIVIPGYAAAKAADPAAKVVLAGPAGWSTSWFDGIFANGGGSSFDIVAYHEYSGSPQNTAATILSNEQSHGGSWPIWLGEYGVEENTTSDVNQQNLMTAVLTSSAPIAVAQWYNLRDDLILGCCPPALQGNDYFGIVQHDDSTLKNGYGTMQGLIGTPPPALTAGAQVASVSGKTVSFSSNVSGGSAPYWYYWDFGDGSSSTQQSPSHTYAAPGTYHVTLSVVDEVGRGATATVSASVTGLRDAALGSTLRPAVARDAAHQGPAGVVAHVRTPAGLAAQAAPASGGATGAANPAAAWLRNLWFLVWVVLTAAGS